MIDIDLLALLHHEIPCSDVVVVVLRKVVDEDFGSSSSIGHSSQGDVDSLRDKVYRCFVQGCLEICAEFLERGRWRGRCASSLCSAVKKESDEGLVTSRVRMNRRGCFRSTSYAVGRSRI